MNFLKSESAPLAGESSVSMMGEIATRGLAAYADEAKRTFDLLWSDPDSIQSKLDRMGNLAAVAFEQHYDTVTHLLRSFARGAFIESGATQAELAALLADAPAWILSHPEHALSQAVLAKMPASTFIPPASYTINSNGTVTLI
jgi:hypothetical protein